MEQIYKSAKLSNKKGSNITKNTIFVENKL